MNTPICDFVKRYAEGDSIKLHMPGHKGKSFLGIESFDITEIDGADSLYEANGIIAESERNASELFGCRTYYSTEGSSQCIKAMMYLLYLYAKSRGEKPYILAGRNTHKAFHSAAALLDIEVDWIYPKNEGYLSCDISAERLAEILKGCEKKPTAIYLTSPDYLGNVLDISEISRVCKENDVLLAIDNAHGAYLRFLTPSKHPIDLGADICCDSAHKTLPVITGGAYLHLNTDLQKQFDDVAIKNAMLLFGSTSPSYLILQSLDMANVYLEKHRSRLLDFVPKIEELKSRLLENGYELYGNEALKITIQTKKYGYLGNEFAHILAEKGIICEFADPDFVVLMLTPEVENLDKVAKALISIPKLSPVDTPMPSFKRLQRNSSVREAILSPSELLPIEECLNKVVAMSTVGCPPAVPIAVAGEMIDENVLECFKYYKIDKINVVK